MPTLLEKLDAFSELGGLNRAIPDHVLKNLSLRFQLRDYQVEALARFQFYYSAYTDKKLPVHLLFHMATGSGKTLLMAGDILYLYEQGYRNFIFFVNSKNIIKKTQANFLDKGSIKYLFADKIVCRDREIHVQEVENFEAVNPDNINIIFTTIQGLHSRLNTPQENTITYEDFKNLKLVFLSDEAHHINALTRQCKKLSKGEAVELSCWENTVNRIFQSNRANIMLEYTATVELDNQAIQEKYADKIIYQYTLKKFREDKFSKDVRILQSDISTKDRVLQSVVVSQYRRKVAEKHKLTLKPVILLKSKRIADSLAFQQKFASLIKNLKKADIQRIDHNNPSGIIKQAFGFFRAEKISTENLIKEIQEDFSEEKCITVNSEADSEEKQITVNTLEAEHNEIRLIFTVNMLNEGWDVLNLFDIVRLYETRDSGNITISEAQLIGRGARYFPFQLSEDQEKYKRKYDEDLANELRVIEELHYHCISEHRYISEITSELVKAGIKPPDDRRREITVSVKDEIKKTRFWKNELLFLNELKRNDFAAVKSLKDIVSDPLFKHRLMTGRTIETTVFENGQKEKESISEAPPKIEIMLNTIEKHILHKGLDKIEFYRFVNLRRHFPALRSIDEFIASRNYLGQVTVEVYGRKAQLDALNNHDKFDMALGVLKELAGKIQANSSDFIGTNEFKAQNIARIIPLTKTIEVLRGGEDQEYGVAMRDAQNPDLRLDLSKHDWYVFNENYGTDQEKYFIQFIRHVYDELKKNYADIYLLRNERIFKIFRFSDGRAIEPDFVLFLTDKYSKKSLSYQLFIEPKGQHLLKNDQWKEDFLKEIETKHRIDTLFETDKYRIVGLPFYNEDSKKQEFTQAFYRIVKADSKIEKESNKKSDLFFSDIIPDNQIKKIYKFKGYLPVYSLEAVATSFGKEEHVERLGWKKIKGGKRFKEDRFIAKVVGKSMEPTIPDGSYCIFRFERGGSRNGLVVLVESRLVTDPETSQKFTIKRYKSEKEQLSDGQWRHKRIILSPDNKGFHDIVIESVSENDFRVVAEFIEIFPQGKFKDGPESTAHNGQDGAERA